MRVGARKNEERTPLRPQNAECFQIALKLSSRRQPNDRRHRAMLLSAISREVLAQAGDLTAGKVRAAAPALLKEGMGF
jgi:hypothetical protein